MKICMAPGISTPNPSLNSPMIWPSPEKIVVTKSTKTCTTCASTTPTVDITVSTTSMKA